MSLHRRRTLILTAQESLWPRSNSVNCCQEDPAPFRVLSKIPSITNRRRECGDWKSIAMEELQEPEVGVGCCSRVDLWADCHILSFAYHSSRQPCCNLWSPWHGAPQQQQVATLGGFEALPGGEALLLMVVEVDTQVQEEPRQEEDEARDKVQEGLWEQPGSGPAKQHSPWRNQSYCSAK